MKGKKYVINFIIILLFLVLSIYITTKFIQLKNINLLAEKSSIELTLDQNNNIGTPEASNKAILSYKLSSAYWIISIILSLLIPFIMFFNGFSVNLKEWCSKKCKMNFLTVGFYLITIYSIYFIFNLPLQYFWGFYKANLIGISNQNLQGWFINILKEYLLNIVVIFLLGWIPYMIINKSKKYWWLIIGCISLPFAVISTIIYPLYIDPIFNEFKPLEDKNIEFKIKDMTESCGIKDVKLYEVDKSKETKAMNAYMTGVLGTKRIILWDNTLKGLDEKEILIVTAHEIGHYVLGHIPKSIIFGCIFSTFILFVVNFISVKIISRYGKKINIFSIKDLSAVPIILMVINLVTFVLAPIPNAYSRYHELEADRFAIELTKDNYSNASVEVKFIRSNISMPTVNTFYKIWRYDHPTPKERINFSNNYRPWEQGKKLKYDKYFIH